MRTFQIADRRDSGFTALIVGSIAVVVGSAALFGIVAHTWTPFLPLKGASPGYFESVARVQPAAQSKSAELIPKRKWPQWLPFAPRAEEFQVASAVPAESLSPRESVVLAEEESAQPMRPRVPEAQFVGPPAVLARLPDAMLTEASPVETRFAELASIHIKPFEAGPAEPNVAEARPVEPRQHLIKAAELKVVTAKPSAAPPVPARLIEAGRAQPKGLPKARAVEAKRVESKPAPAKLAEARRPEPRRAQPKAAPKLAEVKRAEPRAPAAKRAEAKVALKPATLKVSFTKPAESKRIDLKRAESKRAESKAAEARAHETRLAETRRAAEMKAAEAKLADAKRAAELVAVEAKLADTQRAIEMKAAEAKLAETKRAVDATLAEAKLAEAKLAATKRAVEVTLAEAKPAVKPAVETRLLESRGESAKPRVPRYAACDNCGTVSSITRFLDRGKNSWEVRVGFGGADRVFVFPTDPGLAIGERVRYENGRLIGEYPRRTAAL
jgi:hypothetical protein